MARAVCLVRPQPEPRRRAFEAGITAAGYELVASVDPPQRDDVAILWSRYGVASDVADRFECAGARAVVCENGYLGRDWLGDSWVSMAVGHHAGAGRWPRLGAQRWDALGVELADWRDDGTETLILAQRGFGEPRIAAPHGWAEMVQRQIGGRIRQHPDAVRGVSLEDDLQNVKQVVTWNSGAALRCLVLGVPVWYAFPRWIGASACRPLSEFGGEPKRDSAARLAMFRELAWAQWRESEVADGTALKTLLN